MDTNGVARAVAAVTSVAAALDLPVRDVAIIQNSNKLSLRLLPCDVFARVAPMGQEVAALEVELAQQLAATDAPVAALEARVETERLSERWFRRHIVDLLRPKIT